PTLLAGDRSLVSVVAHELAHSWTGNLVSNCNAEHFWLNEGFTVFAERRIVEALYGAETCALQAAVGRRSLEQALTRFQDRPELPAAAPAPRARKLEAIAAIGAELPSTEQVAEWGTTEWELYLESLPRPYWRCAELDARFGLTQRGNYEVLVAWLVLALESAYDVVVPRAEEVLTRVGRMKYLRPLYAALARRPGTRAV